MVAKITFADLQLQSGQAATREQWTSASDALGFAAMDLLRFPLAMLLVSALLPACGGGEEPLGPYVDECSSGAGATRPPEVRITSPGNAEAFASSDAISWVIELSDEDTELDALVVELLDYSSGTPAEVDAQIPGPDGSGRVNFMIEASLLSPGQNPVRARATDPDGCFGEDDVLVCIDQSTCP
ncbi:MAG: hypothetical protein CMP23_13190 [Rickettsiales bacterium]|nr:hypothetical protein [Rickettsiales bacterium]|tara:strand:- start:3369 stop:3920 length:552 start_codon:yes stop_codon:yes gene_type:complete